MAPKKIVKNPVYVRNLSCLDGPNFFESSLSFSYNPGSSVPEFDIFQKEFETGTGLVSELSFKLRMIVRIASSSGQRRRKFKVFLDLDKRAGSPVSIYAGVQPKVLPPSAGNVTEKPVDMKRILEHSRSTGYSEHELMNCYLEFGKNEYCFDFDVMCAKDTGEGYAISVIMKPTTPNEICVPVEKKSSFSSSIGCLLENQMNSDVTLKANGQEWPVHKCILSARSPVFAAMFNGNLMESTANAVEIKDVDSNALDLMIKYIYKDELKDLQGLEMGLLYLADRYDLPDLKKICEIELIKNVNFGNCLTVLLTGVQFNAESLVKKARSFILANFSRICTTDEWKGFVEENAPLSVDLTIAYTRTVKS